MQENRFRHKLKTAEGVNQTLYPIIDPIEGTYAQLLALKNANGLIPGQWYKMTNYQAIWVDPISAIKNVSSKIEKLYIFASDVNTFSVRAISQTYPNDIIYYSITETIAVDIRCGFYHADSRGFIFRRILPNNNDCPYDSRGIIPSFNGVNLNSYTVFDNNLKSKGSIVRIDDNLYLAKKNIIAGNFNNDSGENWIKIIKNGSSYILNSQNNFLMKNNENIIKINLSSSLDFCYNNRVNNLKIEPYLIRDVGGNHLLKLNNIYFNWKDASNIIPAANIYIGKNCRNLSFNGEFRNIKIGADCYNNSFNEKFINNTIGNNCNNNYLINCENNIIGDNFQFNTVGSMIGNQIGNDFQENLISDDFNYNTVGHKFQKKTIKNGFQYKKIDSNLTEEKDLDSYVKLFDDNVLVNLSKGINPQIPETKYMIRFFDPIGLTDVVNVLP